jgi:hypothetical protein
MPSAAPAKKANSNLAKAKDAKQDEFYTQLTDIEKELKHYKKHFRGKVVYCNCDDPKVSNFYRYFFLNFKELGLKRLISTCYKNDNPNERSQNSSPHAVGLEYDGEKETLTRLEGDGDFRSEECIELLKQADIVVTNPPFSLFREFVAQLVEHGKKFLIVGNLNAITYKEIFPLIKDNKVWLGYKNGDMAFKVPDHYEARETRYWQDANGQKWRSLGNASWFTNLDTKKRHEDLILYKNYTPAEYPKYDNYDAIEVGKTCDIPMDYDGVMGVPITFLDKFNPEQFRILGIANSARWIGQECYTIIKGRKIYNRILIERKYK